jgi:hypothetical protein
VARTYAELEIDAFLAEAEQLGQLVTHPCWPTYIALLAKMRLAAFEELGRCSMDDVGHWQGVVNTLAEIMERPARVIALAEETKEDEAENKKFSSAAVRDAIRMIATASPIDGDL